MVTKDFQHINLRGKKDVQVERANGETFVNSEFCKV